MKKQILILLGFGVLVFACNSGQPEETAQEAKKETLNEDELLAQANNFFKPLPEAAPFEGIKVELGKKLYYENRLSASGKMSCNSCHLLDNWGVDNEATSAGHDEVVRGERNSPTVYNTWFHVAQFWDGRAADLAEQAKGPILNPIEMGMPSEVVALDNIKKDETYIRMFKEAFPEEKNPITFDNVAKAIAEFEKTLSTPAPFDDYLKGDKSALSHTQKEGLKLFVETGCITCHMGPGLGGNMYQKFGLIKGPYWEYTGSEVQDKGRYMATEQESDMYFFKVPALRNVEKTHPYFHDGSVADLDKAVKIMAEIQLNKELSDEETEKIVAFLKSLTGEIPEHALQESEETSASL